MKNVVMLVISLVVAGAMAGTVLYCLRRLRKIEEDLWGKKGK